jgi:hypothetical protein
LLEEKRGTFTAIFLLLFCLVHTMCTLAAQISPV